MQFIFPQISELYESMEYTKILQSTVKFLKDDVSAFYTTLIKDRYFSLQTSCLVYIPAENVALTFNYFFHEEQYNSWRNSLLSECRNNLPLKRKLFFICVSRFLLYSDFNLDFNQGFAQVQTPALPPTFLRDWSWNNFYMPDNSLSTADSSRAVISYWQKYVFLLLVNCLAGLSLPRNSKRRLTNCSQHDINIVDWAVNQTIFITGSPRETLQAATWQWLGQNNQEWRIGSLSLDPELNKCYQASKINISPMLFCHLNIFYNTQNRSPREKNSSSLKILSDVTVGIKRVYPDTLVRRHSSISWIP